MKKNDTNKIAISKLVHAVFLHTSNQWRYYKKVITILVSYDLLKGEILIADNSNPARKTMK